MLHLVCFVTLLSSTLFTNCEGRLTGGPKSIRQLNMFFIWILIPVVALFQTTKSQSNILASSYACFSAVNKTYSTIFNAPYNGTIESVTLEHINGSVTCSGSYTSNNWGCGNSPSGHLFTYLYKVTSNTNYIGIPYYPTSNTVGYNAIDGGYNYNGITAYDNILTITTPTYAITILDEFMLQYSEAYNEISLSGNSGTACAKVSFIYSDINTDSPSKTPSKTPTDAPSKTPSNTPSKAPSDSPSKTPTNTPTKSPGPKSIRRLINGIPGINFPCTIIGLDCFDTIEDAIRAGAITVDDAINSGKITIYGAIDEGLISPVDAVRDGLIDEADAIQRKLVTLDTLLQEKAIAISDAVKKNLISPALAISKGYTDIYHLIETGAISKVLAVQQQLISV